MIRLLAIPFAIFVLICEAGAQAPASIPLPEHPRPDFERTNWINLNGTWEFRFDSANVGLRQQWFGPNTHFDQSIQVPFSWAAPLAQVTGDADIGWYRRTLTIPTDWSGERVFINIGASDRQTTVWLDGQEVGRHVGGYIPFSFELTRLVRSGAQHNLVIRVDDTHRDFMLEGKQGYGQARGIWQTVYLETRGRTPISSLHFEPDIDDEQVNVHLYLQESAPTDMPIRLRFMTGNVPDFTYQVPQGEARIHFTVPIPEPHLWSLEDPFLYEVEARLGTEQPDVVNTYFGMRKISVVDLPGTDIPYVALNNKPVYLQLALDQAYHPNGFYTFPSDDFMRDEILRSRQIGLNGQRIHVKIGIPRKLYWADRLGMLIMADVPNSWGEPDAAMRSEIDTALRGMIERDYNHPSIFSWVVFNETWGLFTDIEENGEEQRRYLPETQQWVVRMYRLAKTLDPTRLVEDNSVCCGRGHTETDLNSWHYYLPGWAWEDTLRAFSTLTYEGSTWNFEDGYRQGLQPNINSEFGNVWGYEGSTGDVDWSWDYHRAVNAFRRHPKIAGWLYTEHHDVINEWNGYWRFDRSEKYTGLEDLVEGMSLRDLHAPIYIATDNELSREVETGQRVEVPLWASFLTDLDLGNTLKLEAELYGWDRLGRKQIYHRIQTDVAYRPWRVEALQPLTISMPHLPGLAVLSLVLKDEHGVIHHRNFTTFIVQGEFPRSFSTLDGDQVVRQSFEPNSFVESQWTRKQWEVLDGAKVNGAGAGTFTYRIPWPEDVHIDRLESATLVFEASSKQLFGKDRTDGGTMEGDYMRGRGTFDPSLNPNAYPMTDETTFPSAVAVRVNETVAGRYDLPDDPADHRGILSWHYQLKDRKLREAGSYGWLIQVPLPLEALHRAAEAGSIVIRFEVDEALPGGLAMYGSRFGRYPLDPTLLFTMSR